MHGQPRTCTSTYSGETPGVCGESTDSYRSKKMARTLRTKDMRRLHMVVSKQSFLASANISDALKKRGSRTWNALFH